MMDFAHFKTAMQFRRWPRAQPFARTILYRKLAARALAELARRNYDHKFSTVQVNLPQDLQDELQAWVDKNISPTDLHPTEKQEPPFHITVKYGLHAKRPDAVKTMLEGWGPIKLTLGSIDAFTTNDDYDVLIIRAQSGGLVEINRRLSDSLPHTNTQAFYNPHVTLAYLKKGAGENWIDRKDFFGRSFNISEVQFGSADDDIGKTDISLVRDFTCAYCGIHRYHLPGQHDQCDHSPTGECVDEEKGGPRSELFKAERDIVKQDMETGIIFNQKGIEASRIKGTKDKVSIPPEVIIGAQIDGSATFTHNHPNGAGFSLADLQSAQFMNLKEMRAVGVNKFGKFTYILERPTSGWPDEDKIRTTYRKWRSVVEPVVANRIFKQKILSMEQGVTASGHATIKLTAKELGIPYRMIRVRPKSSNA